MARVGKKIGACRDLVGKSEEKKPLARQRRRKDNIIKIDFQVEV